MIYETQVFGSTKTTTAPATLTGALECLVKEFSPQNPPRGYLQGRTRMRNAIADHTGCSLARAEELVEELEARGHLVYEGDTYSPERISSSWSVTKRIENNS